MVSSSSNNSDHYAIIILRHVEEDKECEKKQKKLSKVLGYQTRRKVEL